MTITEKAPKYLKELQRKNLVPNMIKFTMSGIQ